MPDLIKEILVPRCEGRSWTVNAGQEVRIVAVEGPQAADVIAWSAADPRESLSAWLTRHMSRNFGRATTIYSKLPAGRPMFTVLTDRPGLLWLSPGRCNRLKYPPGHPNCQDILAATIAPYGMSAFDVPEVLRGGGAEDVEERERTEDPSLGPQRAAARRPAGDHQQQPARHRDGRVGEQRDPLVRHVIPPEMETLTIVVPARSEKSHHPRRTQTP